MKHYLGIDLGGTNIAAGITDETGSITAKYSAKTNAAQPFEGLVRDIAETAKKAVEIAGLELSDIAAVGLGTPSCINPRTNLLVNANNLNWQNVPLYDELKKYFDMPVFIQNDAACAALGEAICGAAARYENAVMVTLGTGVGSGIIMNKRIFNGCDDMGAEIGHTKLVYDGLPCTCGQKGCFEAYASATALINQARNAANQNPESAMNEMCGGDMSKMNAKIPFDAAKAGDITAEAVIEKYIDYLAAGLSSAIALFRPQAIIIGGGVSAEGDYLISPLKKKLFDCTFSAEQIDIPEIVTARLGNDAGIIGAAMLCRA
ncbi:MAG: ROK family protein [Huintestinicola sp.]|uniref:ROK family protein n=1 Tax=Huintestinicola sp. TaxID=2981661 RepID=UPI003F11D7BF